MKSKTLSTSIWYSVVLSTLLLSPALAQTSSSPTAPSPDPQEIERLLQELRKEREGQNKPRQRRLKPSIKPPPYLIGFWWCWD